MIRINLTSVFVDDQAKALAFYTDVLGFQAKNDVPLGEHRWLTVVSPADPDGVELLLEPAGHPAVGPYRQALVADGIPAASFAVDDVWTHVTDRLHLTLGTAALVAAGVVLVTTLVLMTAPAARGALAREAVAA